MPKFPNPVGYAGRKGTQEHTGQAKFASSAEAVAGVKKDVMISPSTLSDSVDDLIPDASVTVSGKVRLATVGETTTGTAVDIATTPAGVAAVAIAGSPDATETSKGIVELATNAESVTGTDTNRAIVCSSLTARLAAPGEIGGTTPAAGNFTNLDADGTGVISLDADAASNFSVAGAGIDLSLISAAGRVIVNGEEAIDNAITIVSAAGGIDLDSALSTTISSSENSADSIVIESSAGGIDVIAAGAAGEDIDITCTAGSVNITAGESAENSISIVSSIGGINISAAAAAAGEDIDITATGSSINIISTEAVANAVVIDASNAAGGIDMDCGTGGFALDVASGAVSVAAGAASDITMAGAGIDLTLASAAGRVIVNGEEAAANAITLLSAAGGIDADAALQINLASSQVAATAIVVNASAGGVTIDAATSMSVGAATASDFTVTNAGEDLTLESTLGRVIVNGEEAATDAITLLSAAGGLDCNCALEINIDSSEAAVADAVRIVASAADGGIDIDAGTGGIAIDSTGAISIAGAAASDLTVGGAGIDLTLESTLGRVVVNAEEAADNAITLLSAAGGLDVDVALQLNLTSSEVAVDAVVINASGGGIDITAGTNDIDVTASAGSVNISSAEAVSDAIVIDASNAAGGIDLSAGTGGISMDSGLTVNVTAVANGATPYTVLGTDYFITTNTTGGVLTLTLPAAPATGRSFVISDGVGQAAANTVTVDGGAKNIIVAGASAVTYALNGAYESLSLVYDGTSWIGRLVA